MDRELTLKQERLVELAASGLADKEIAVQLGISHGTVHTYWKRLRVRYGAHSRGEIIARIQKWQNGRTELELSELHAISETLMNSVDQGVAVFDDGMRILKANLAIAQLFGYTTDEIVGQNVVSLLPEAMQVAGARAFERALFASQRIEKEWWIPARNGGCVHVTCSLSPLTVGGRQLLLIAARDTSEDVLLHFLENGHWGEFSVRAESLGKFVWSATPEGNVDFANGWSERYSGVPSDAWSGSGCKCVIAEHEKAVSAERWEAAKQHSRPYRARAEFWSQASASYRSHSIRMSPLYRQGKVDRWVGTATCLEKSSAPQTG